MPGTQARGPFRCELSDGARIRRRRGPPSAREVIQARSRFGIARDAISLSQRETSPARLVSLPFFGSSRRPGVFTLFAVARERKKKTLT